MKQFLRLLALTCLVIFNGPVFAQTANSVYIEQIGSNSTITATQTGSNNMLGTNTTSAYFSGNNQTVAMTQIGSNNTANMNIQGANANVSALVTGSLNTTTINCGNAPTSSCTDGVLSANATGDNNTITVAAVSKSTATVDVTGSNNSVAISNSTTNLLGARARVTTTGGDYNAVTVDQNGPAGGNGFDATVLVTGANNTIGVTQSGTIDSTVNIKSTGSNNTITVRSGN
jgi:hypothetical protein